MSEANRGDLFVVDDNPNNLALLTGILREAGFSVRLANSGRRALDAITKAPPELVLLDVTMPDLDGYAVCAALRASPRTSDVPVIFLSALDDVKDKVSAFRAGGQDYVTKPFQAEEVLVRVETQLKLARVRSELERSNQALERKNQELERAWADADLLFGAFSDLLAGTLLDERYRLEAKVGSGGSAAVYRATHLPSGRTVAIKVMRPQPGADAAQRRRTLNEGRSVLRLDHPHAVTVLDSGATPGGVHYLVMELLEGESLEEHLQRQGPLSPARVAELVRPVCSVLAAAHAAGIVHRDVKPANIFLHRDEAGERVKVVDFGIAKLDDELAATQGGTTVGRLLGTPVFMSPERLLGKPYDGRADVYGLGVTLYRMLTGLYPYALPESLGGIILACVHEPPTPLRRARPDLPVELEALVARMLAKAPLERPRMDELDEALAQALGGGGVAPRSDPSVGAGETLDAPLRR